MTKAIESLFDARRDGREGMVTVVDYEGRIVGSMGVETWAKVLAEGDSGSLFPARPDDPLAGANCSLCGATADNFHVSDDLWERVGLGPVQACFKCFRIAAWHVGVRPDPGWQVSL